LNERTSSIAVVQHLCNLGCNVAQETLHARQCCSPRQDRCTCKGRSDGHLRRRWPYISDAFRMMLMRTVAERALPFDPLTPSAETVEAMKAARRGELVKVGSVQNLMADLHADDSPDQSLRLWGASAHAPWLPKNLIPPGAEQAAEKLHL